MEPAHRSEDSWLEHKPRSTGKHPCRQLNLIGHGRGGAIRFGPEWINRKDLLKQADRLAKWDLERIALWSCELGQDSRFATTLEYLTGVAWPLVTV